MDGKNNIMIDEMTKRWTDRMIEQQKTNGWMNQQILQMDGMINRLMEGCMNGCDRWIY